MTGRDVVAWLQKMKDWVLDQSEAHPYEACFMLGAVVGAVGVKLLEWVF